jgi:hypothetical protein
VGTKYVDMLTGRSSLEEDIREGDNPVLDVRLGMLTIYLVASSRVVWDCSSTRWERPSSATYTRETDSEQVP